MKIEPGDLCWVLPGGTHGWGCGCMEGRFVVVSTPNFECPAPAWNLSQPEPCRTGQGPAIIAWEKYLQPIRPTPASIDWEREHEMPSEARKTELDNARWVVEKA